MTYAQQRPGGGAGADAALRWLHVPVAQARFANVATAKLEQRSAAYRRTADFFSA